MRRPTLVLLLIVLASAGCSYLIPPQKIPLDRENYMKAVSTSWKEQLLNNLVMLRYGDTLTSLELISVTTGYELDLGLSASNTINWNAFRNTTGFHDTTPLGATASYSDKPTISYVPMRGDELQRTMLEPIPPLSILKGLRVLNELADSLLPYCVSSINGWRSPEDPQLLEFAKLFVDLCNVGAIRITLKEPVEPKVTKVPDEITVTLIKKTKGTGKDEPVKGPGVKNGAKSQQGKNCAEVTDKKKEDGAVAYLVVDNNRARSEDVKKLNACIRNGLNDIAKAEELVDCMNESFEHSEIGAQCAKGVTLMDYVSKSLDTCAKSANLTASMAKNLQNCPKGENLTDCLTNNLQGCAKGVIAEDELCKLKEFLWPRYAIDKKMKWSDLYENKCGNCHEANDPKFQTGDLDQKITQATCGYGQSHKIAMTSNERQEIISFINHSNRGYEVYEIINANEQLPFDPYCKKIFVRTRSVLQTLAMVSKLIHVPKEDIDTKMAGKGLTESGPEKEEAMELAKEGFPGDPGGPFTRLNIHSAPERPEDAFVAINYCGRWFYIKNTDIASKIIFSSILGVLSMAETGTSQGVPILTLPVQ